MGGGDGPASPREVQVPRGTADLGEAEGQLDRARQVGVEAGEVKDKKDRELATLAEETGGRISSPKSKDEMLSEADAVMRDLGAQYVVSYRPTRPLATAAAGEHRQLQIASRRVGLNLHSRRGYVVVK